MLVLTRQIDEKIIIAETIEVQVLGIKNGCVKIGIRCPGQIPIVREELLRKAASQSEVEAHELVGV